MSKNPNNKLRWRQEREQYLREAKSFKILRITLSEVVFRYNGTEVTFEPYEHTVVMNAQNPHMPYMSPEDHAFLYSIAKELLDANLTGVKLAKKRSAKSPDKGPSAKRDLRQQAFPL